MPRVPATADCRHDVDDLAGPCGARNEAGFLGLFVAESYDVARGVGSCTTSPFWISDAGMGLARAVRGRTSRARALEIFMVFGF
jgi:hypothetical protein